MNITVDGHRINSLPYVLINFNNIIIDVGERFISLSRWSKNEVIGNNVNCFFHNNLKLYNDVDTIVQRQKSCFIFTKDFEPREVEIEVYAEREYKAIIFHENTSSMIRQGISYVHQYLKHNLMAAAIFQADSFILLKANEIFLNFFDKPHNLREYSVGLSLYEISKGWRNTSYSEWQKILETGEPLIHKEFAFNRDKSGTLYLDITVMPIYENEITKYIVVTAVDVTENVINRKLIEEQNKRLKLQAEQLQFNIRRIEEQSKIISEQKEQLEVIMENMTEALFVLDRTGKYILVNKAGRLGVGKSLENIGDSLDSVKFFDLDGSKIPLENTPNYQVLCGRTVHEKVMLMKTPKLELYIAVSGVPIFDENGEVLYGIIISRDVTDKVKYEQQIVAKNKQLEAIIEKSMMQFLFLTNTIIITCKTEQQENIFQISS